MIFYLVTREHAYTLTEHLETWGRSQRKRIRPLFYDQLPYLRNLQRGRYIFSDLERLTDPQMQLAKHLFDTIVAAKDIPTPLNNPAKVLRREPMLRELFRTGRNPFTVFRPDEDRANMKFPVFVRSSNGHDVLTSLLYSADELDQSLQSLREKHGSNLLIIEFTDTADESKTYRKYSAFCVDGKIIPRHVFHSSDWLLKSPKTVNASTVEEEEIYLRDNPHEKLISEIFRIAAIDYGRIDYSMTGEKIVTWEINTNPMSTLNPANIAVLRLPAQSKFGVRFCESLDAIDSEPRSPLIPFRPPAKLLKDLGIRRRDVMTRKTGVLIRKIVSRWPLAKSMQLSEPIA